MGQDIVIYREVLCCMYTKGRASLYVNVVYGFLQWVVHSNGRSLKPSRKYKGEYNSLTQNFVYACYSCYREGME